MTQHRAAAVPTDRSRPAAAGVANECAARSRVILAAADVIDLVGEAVAAVAIRAGDVLGAALPRERALRVIAADGVIDDHRSPHRRAERRPVPLAEAPR